MGKLIIEGIPGADGTYDADLTYFTNRELHEIKKQTGLRAGDLMDAFEAGDNDVVVAFALVALGRLGKAALADLLWDAPAGTGFRFDFTDEEEAAAKAAEDPPQVTPTGGVESVNGNGDASDSSGDSSRLLLALPESDPSPTGFPG